MTVTPLRLGLVGLGRQMTQVLIPALLSVADCEISAVCDVDAGRLAWFQRFFAAPAAFEDAAEMFASTPLDAVIVAIRHDENAAVLEAALRAGLPAFVEKTPVSTAAIADELGRVQRDTGRFVMVGFNRRFTDDNARAKALSAAPEFGGVHLYQSQFHASAYDEGAFKLAHIIHHLDLARFLLGEIELTQVQRVRVADTRIGYTISFRAETGALGTIQAGSFLDPTYPVERLELLGSGGNIVVDRNGLLHNPPPGTTPAATAPSAGTWTPTAYRPPHRNLLGYESELQYFAERVRDGLRPSPDIEDSAKTLRLVERIDELLL